MTENMIVYGVTDMKEDLVIGIHLKEIVSNLKQCLNNFGEPMNFFRLKTPNQI